MRLTFDRPTVAEASDIELERCQLPEALFRARRILREHCTQGADRWAKTKNIARRVPREQDASVLRPEEGEVASGVAGRMDSLNPTVSGHFVSVIHLFEHLDRLLRPCIS